MAKKVFYNRRYKMPGWAQPYALWGVAAAVTLAVVAFTSVEIVKAESAEASPARVNGFADGLFYELRDAEAGGQAEVVSAYAARLKKKHGYAVRESKTAGCQVITVDRGKATPFGIAAIMAGERSEAIYAALVFLDKLAAQNPTAAITTALVVAQKNCDTRDFIAEWLLNDMQLPVILEAGSADSADFNRIGYLKNLNLRRHFPGAFLAPERATWANATALISEVAGKGVRITINNKFGNGPEQTVAENPLLRHPLAGKAAGNADLRPVALYLGSATQLHTGGFYVLLGLIWLLAVIPFANALGTFRERLDLGSAATSLVLYGLAFFSYVLLLKLSLRYVKTDLVLGGVVLLLVPLVFFPVRILQKTMLRAELNRAGLHLLLQILLTIVCFTSPLTAILGLISLTAASAYARAPISRKLLRLMSLAAVAALFVMMTREPLGSFTNFFSAYLPPLAFSSLASLALLCAIGGSIVALLFVPRERN